MTLRAALLALALWCCGQAQAHAPLVLLTDFGTQDGAVSAMKGVAYSVSQDLLVSDLSHENPSIFVGAYRLYQAEQFWPKDTVFVAVVDPGVGTARLSVALNQASYAAAHHIESGPDWFIELSLPSGASARQVRP